MTDTLGAFMVGPTLLAAGAPSGPLAGRTFAVKDVLDVAGYPTGAGSPEWLAGAEPAPRSARVVSRLLAAGADLMGKTVTDELAYSINGINVYYGTPHNSAAPGHLPGGSSSGSAAAVAGGLVDFAVGTDTGGSIRVPASYCGLYGLRPTWGRVPVAGLVHLAPSFDTVGLLARGADTLQLAATAVLDPWPAGATGSGTTIILATDAWEQLDPGLRSAMATAFERVLQSSSISLEWFELAGQAELTRWAEAFRVLQSYEAWALRGVWLTARQPRLGADIAARFRDASLVTAAATEPAAVIRDEVRARFSTILSDGRVLAMPCTAGPAPPVDVADEPLAELRRRTFRLNCGPGLAGLPVVVVPLPRRGELPVGVALIGAPGGDERLLDLAMLIGASQQPDQIGSSMSA